MIWPHSLAVALHQCCHMTLCYVEAPSFFSALTAKKAVTEEADKCGICVV